MKKFTLIIAAALAACSSASDSKPESALSKAEDAITARNYQDARNACACLSDTTLDLLPSQLCRKALVYARLADACKQPEDMDVAIRSYAQALAISPDSVRYFIDHLTTSDRADFFLLQELQRAIANPVEPGVISDSALSDSILNDYDEE